MRARNFVKLTLLFFIMLLSSLLPLSSASAQYQLTDSIGQKMAMYARKNPSSLLFVHFDKTIYTSNETAWFTGYLLKSADMKLHTVLSVALVKAADRKVVAEKQFVMKDGLAFGDLLIPDSLAGGRYLFMAYTNVMRNGEPVRLFVQPITVKTIVDPPFSASLKLIDTAAVDGFYKVRLEGFNKDRMLLSGAALRWNPLSGAKVMTALTDIRGEYVFQLPSKEVNAKNALFETDITYKKETRRLSIKLPVKSKEYILRCFPESGYLVNGIETFVGIEATTANGDPLVASAVLYKNGVPADTVHTNSLGIGKFTIFPTKESSYILKLGETTVALPAVLEKGAVITLNNAVLNDTLRFVLRTNTNEKTTLLVHNYNEAYLSAVVNSKQNNSAIINLPLADVPRGINALTVLDERGKPLAERLFFAHYDNADTLEVTTGKQEYQQREKVTVDISLLGKDGSPLQGIVSVACIQDTRLEGRNRNDIQNYYYLQSVLGKLPRDPIAKGFRNSDYINDLLLVKGWRKYTWQEMTAATSADTLASVSAIQFTGKVLKNERPLKKAENLSIVHLPYFGTAATSANGEFAIPDSVLQLDPDKKARISVATKNPDDYTIFLKNPYIIKNKALAEALPPDMLQDRPEEAFTEALLIARNERAIILNEVKITTKKDRQEYFGWGANKCGDYVCSFNIFNCPNHRNSPGNHPPVQGHTYKNLAGPYTGCGNAMDEPSSVVNLSALYFNKEFYGSDYTVEDVPLPEYFSTIYWNHAILLNGKGKATLSFYTSDLTGSFSIIAQGITREDVIYAQKKFTVNKKK